MQFPLISNESTATHSLEKNEQISESVLTVHQIGEDILHPRTGESPALQQISSRPTVFEPEDLGTSEVRDEVEDIIPEGCRHEVTEDDVAEYSVGLQAFQEKNAQRTSRRNEEIDQKQLKLEQKWLFENQDVYNEHLQVAKNNQIYDCIKTAREKINALVTHWEPIIDEFSKHPFNDSTRCLYQMARELKYIFMKEKDLKIGVGGIYRGQCKDGLIGIKVKGEGACELNNNRGRASALAHVQPKFNIPSYKENEREAATYEYACHIGLPHITPPVVLGMILDQDERVLVMNEAEEIKEKRRFSDISDRLCMEELVHVQSAGVVNPKKICSIQSWVENGSNLDQIVNQWTDQACDELEAIRKTRNSAKDEILPLTEDYIQDYIGKRIDFDDFEDCNVLVWTSGETDANTGNYLAYLKDTSKNTYGLIKIDNAYAYPESNKGFLNTLVRFKVLAYRPISARARKILMRIEKQHYQQPLTKYEIGEKALEATEKRIEVIKKILEEFPEITHHEMDFRLKLFAKGGEIVALRKVNPTELGITPAARKQGGKLSFKAAARNFQKIKSKLHFKMKRIVRKIKHVFFAIIRFIVERIMFPSIAILERISRVFIYKPPFSRRIKE